MSSQYVGYTPNMSFDPKTLFTPQDVFVSSTLLQHGHRVRVLRGGRPGRGLQGPQLPGGRPQRRHRRRRRRPARRPLAACEGPRVRATATDASAWALSAPVCAIVGADARNQGCRLSAWPDHLQMAHETHRKWGHSSLYFLTKSSQTGASRHVTMHGRVATVPSQDVALVVRCAYALPCLQPCSRPASDGRAGTTRCRRCSCTAWWCCRSPTRGCRGRCCGSWRGRRALARWRCSQPSSSCSPPSACRCDHDLSFMARQLVNGMQCLRVWRAGVGPAQGWHVHLNTVAGSRSLLSRAALRRCVRVSHDPL